ncbi:unnamed protein product [Prunus armeniaca]
MKTSYRKRHSLLLENDVAVGVARSLVTPRDVRVLGMRDNNRVVSDAMALSVRSAASVASVGHRLIVKSYERVIRSLKRERENTVEANRHLLEILHEENQKLSKMVDFYSQDMQKQLEALDQLGKCKHRDHHTSYVQAKGVIFGSSSDEPQEAVCENPKEEIQKAKLKAPIVES